MVISSGIRSLSQQADNRYIIYDAALDGQISGAWFEPQYWRKHAELHETGPGRGQSWFVQSGDREFVLRHYCRGGLMAKITTDRYAWTGLQRTRAWREYQLLVRLHESGLPAPRPVAAQVVRHGAYYVADLITVRIPDSRPLSEILMHESLGESQWRAIGACIAGFHREHIHHADLNAHNILIDGQARVYLIDFDKGSVDQDISWQDSTLQRLRRSLQKLSAADESFQFRESDWQALLAGYSST